MAITRDTLVTRSQTLYDVSGSGVLSASEWADFVNDAIRALYSVIIGVCPDFRVNSTNFTVTTTATPSTSLPADFRSVRAVIRDPGQTTHTYLNRFAMRAAALTYERSYRVDGTTLVIEPAERAPGSYQLRYNPQAPTLASGSANLDSELEQFQEFIALHAACKALAREESDFGGLAALMATAKEDARHWAATQRTADPDGVEDVRGRRWSRTGWTLP